MQSQHVIGQRAVVISHRVTPIRKHPRIQRHQHLTNIKMLCSSFSISRLAIPSVCALIGFLAYSSQYFFLHFEPAPLTKEEAWRLNIAALCIWITYYRSCTVDPGRIPKDWRPAGDKQSADDGLSERQRWCRRCEAFKPPRAHHCKTCQR